MANIHPGVEYVLFKNHFGISGKGDIVRMIEVSNASQ